MFTAHRARRRSVRVVSAGTVLAATALVGVTVLGGVAPAVADGKVVIGGGAGIVVEGDTYCTLTAIGNDRTGAMVGFTSAHCGAPALVPPIWNQPVCPSYGVLL